MGKNIQPEDVTSMGYRVDVHLKHEELIPFVREHLYSKSPFSVFYWIFNMLVLVACIAAFYFSPAPFMKNLDKFCIGFIGFFVLIPVHELIHGIGYRLAGAPKVSYNVIWKKLIFYAMADRFVARRIPFTLLAIAPFILLNTLLIALYFILPGPWNMSVLGALLLHTAGCAGDFALMSYMHKNRRLEPLTWDDVAGGTSTFVVRG